MSKQEFVFHIVDTLVNAGVSVYGECISTCYRATVLGTEEIPKSIDCFISKSGPAVYMCRVIDNKRVYMSGVMHHANGNVTYAVRSPCSTYHILVNFLCDVVQDPLAKFKCESLILDKDGYRIANNAYPISEVLQEIEDKKAVITPNIDLRKNIKKIKHMFEMGWSVIEPGCVSVDSCRCTGHEHKSECYKADTCVICCDDLTDQCIQRTCCKVSYHSGCYMAMRSHTGLCPGCRTIIH